MLPGINPRPTVPYHPMDEELSLHPSEQKSLTSPQRAKIARYHPKKQMPLLEGPGRWGPHSLRAHHHSGFFQLPAVWQRCEW